MAAGWVHAAGPKILVADDEAMIATTLRAILEQQGYRVGIALDGESAVRVAASFEPDVLVSDIQMPKKNGIDAAMEIVHAVPSCHVLLYTAKALPWESLAKARARGHDFTIIEKPIAPGCVLDTIREIIKRKRTSFGAVVLNVDDDDIQRYAVSRMLTHRGLVVREARTGAEALAEARKQPALILLDINLPDMSGFEVCRRLKASPETAHIPVVHLTNTYRDEAAKAQALSLGADGFFAHPVQPDALLAKLREFIDVGS